ncbi:MAG: hypothetical protein ACRC3J_09250 [Culicoidibacterales bacterium]
MFIGNLNTRDSDSFVGTELSKLITYVVEVDSFSRHRLIVDTDCVEVISNGGRVINVGMFGDLPVCMVLTVITVNDQYVLMYEPTSLLVHYGMIEDWLKENYPHLFEESRHRKTDAQNFHNVIHYTDDLND